MILLGVGLPFLLLPSWISRWSSLSWSVSAFPSVLGSGRGLASFFGKQPQAQEGRRKKANPKTKKEGPTPSAFFRLGLPFLLEIEVGLAFSSFLRLGFRGKTAPLQRMTVSLRRGLRSNNAGVSHIHLCDTSALRLVTIERTNKNVCLYFSLVSRLSSLSSLLSPLSLSRSLLLSFYPSLIFSSSRSLSLFLFVSLSPCLFVFGIFVSCSLLLFLIQCVLYLSQTCDTE